MIECLWDELGLVERTIGIELRDGRTGLRMGRKGGWYTDTVKRVIRFTWPRMDLSGMLRLGTPQFIGRISPLFVHLYRGYQSDFSYLSTLGATSHCSKHHERIPIGSAGCRLRCQRGLVAPQKRPEDPVYGFWAGSDVYYERVGTRLVFLMRVC